MANWVLLRPESTRKNVMEQSKWWDIFTDKLKDKLNMEFSEMKYLGIFDLEEDRLNGLTPTETVQYLIDDYGLINVCKLIKDGYREDKMKENEENKTENYFKYIGLINE